MATQLATEELTLIDVHVHHVPNAFFDWIERNPHAARARVETDLSGNRTLVHDQGYAYPLPLDFVDVDACRTKQAKAGVEYSLLSPPPTLFYYTAPPRLGAEIARLINEGMAQAATRDDVGAFGIVPLQAPEEACTVLNECVTTHGLHGVLIGTEVEGKPLDHPDFREFWQEADRLGALLAMHPYYVGTRSQLADFYMTNLIGNPLNTAVCAARLILSGTLDAYEDVRLLLVHGGGFLPYQIGRLDHGYQVRPEANAFAKNLPSSYLRRFHYDSITFNERSVEFLAEVVGRDRVVFGSDSPFDMADWPSSLLTSDAKVSARIPFRDNAARLLRLDH